MMRAYGSGDPYLEFAKLARLVPPEATKRSHGPQREAAKACVLGVQYAMGPDTLALRIGQAPIVARDLLRAHREAFPIFWRWSDAAVDHAILTGHLCAVFGWQLHVAAGFNPRSLRNFPMQANGAEMLRLACCLATERDIEVCAPVHDAILICAPLERIEADVAAAQAAMGEAARTVLGGFDLRSDANIIRYPSRYMDPRGVVMWDRVMGLISNQQQVGTAA